jgi:hypothetical protein
MEVTVQKILIPIEIWNTIFDYVFPGDGNFIPLVIGRRFISRSMLPNRMVSKTFNDLILRSIRSVRIPLTYLSNNDGVIKKLKVLLSRPVLLRNLTVSLKSKAFDMNVFANLVCCCEELRTLHIYWKVMAYIELEIAVQNLKFLKSLMIKLVIAISRN